MKKIYLGLLISFLSTTIHAQDPSLEWVKSMGGIDVDWGRSITTDALGNLLITGHFEGTVDFNPGSATFNLISNGNTDVFVQKLDSNGNFIWAKSMGGGFNDWGFSITTDASGNVYVTGNYEATVDFNPGAATVNLTSKGGRDVFIQKLDAGGNFIWAKSVGGTSNDISGSIITDASANVYITGAYVGTVDFDPGAATFNLTSNGSDDVFLQKLDAGGNFIWAKSMGGKSSDAGRSVTVDASGNLYVTGSYIDTADFDPGVATFNLISNGWLDVFIQKLDSSGNFIWAKSMGGGSNDWGYSITIDASDNVLITGNFRDTVDFDPGAATFNLTSNGFDDVFIQKLDTAGNFIWAKSVGGIFYDEVYSITTDILGNVYVTGSYDGTVDFDPGAATFNLTSKGVVDVFILKLDPVGNLVWAISIGGTFFDIGYSITIDASGNVYTTGYYWGLADFDPSAVTFNLTSNGFFDVFILKINQCMVDVSVTITDPSITANTTGALYQWLDCNNNYALITGETAQSFTASVNGDYAVEITKNGCADTSVCITISTLSIEKNPLFNSVSIFPNPNHGLIIIDLGDLKEVSIKMFSASGQLIYQVENINTAIHQFKFNEAPGVYIIEVSSKGEKQQYKLVKE